MILAIMSVGEAYRRDAEYQRDSTRGSCGMACVTMGGAQCGSYMIRHGRVSGTDATCPDRSFSDPGASMQVAAASSSIRHHLALP